MGQDERYSVVGMWFTIPLENVFRSTLKLNRLIYSEWCSDQQY